MNEEVSMLWKQLCTSLMIYAGAAGVPRYLHIPDIISSALDNNLDQVKLDIKLLVRTVLEDSAFVLVSEIKDSSLKEKLNKSLDSLKRIEDYDVFRSKCADFIDYTLDELGIKK